MSNQLHTLKVSAEGVMKNLGDQFTSASTFIKELAQNARRAGATHVSIYYDKEAGILVFQDDGKGIDSPASLLTIGESGWDNLELIEKENPFGVGFASAIFAASEIRVETVSWAMTINTSELLKLKPVAVQESDRSSGTTITLKLLDSVHESIKTQAVFTKGWLNHTFSAFEIPVIVNDEAVDRKDVLDSRYQKFDLGHFYSEFRPDSNYLTSIRVYLQGMCVYDDSEYHGSRRYEPEFILHLDPSKFRARVPDRDQLIDESEVIRMLRNQVKSLWEAKLQEVKSELPEDIFLSKYWDVVAEIGATELVNDLPVPAGKWAIFSEPAKFGRWSGASEEKLETQKQDLPKGSVVIDDLTYDDEADSAMAVYAFKRELPVITGRIPVGHWSNDTSLYLGDIQFSIKEQTPIKEVKFESSNIWGMTISVCESYVITTDSEDKETFPDIVVDDEPVFCPQSGVYLLPKKAVDGIEELLLLTNCYEEEFSVDDDALDRDIDSLRDIVKLAMGGTPEEAVTGLLNEGTHFLRQQLAGKSFSVTFDDDGNVTVKQQ